MGTAASNGTGGASTDWDVIIVGAGPGGSSAAAALAEGGVRVLVLEREEFPRFHIGESLLPAAELITNLLGIDQDPNVFLYKRGAQFLCEETGRSESFDFAEAMPGPQRYAWHVDRPKFDTLIRDNAVEAGADIRHGFQVTDVDFEADQVRVHFQPADAESDPPIPERAQDSATARYLIDATGQDRFLAKKMGTGRGFEQFGRAAVSTHFSNISEAARNEFSPHNDIRIIVIPDGWLWCIPLTGNRLSAGLVSRKAGLRKRHLDDYMENSPFFQRVLPGAERSETRLTGNFSFENVESIGARYACVGDSACFIDPVFSSGVSLAIFRGIDVGERLITALEAGCEGDPALMQPMTEKMKRAYDTFAGLVYRFYNTKFVDNIIFGAPKDGQFRDGVISVLAGDVFREDNPFQEMLLQSKRHSIRSAPLPPESGEQVGR